MISSLKIKIIAKILRGIGMCFWCCWKDLDEQDLMEFIWYDLDSEYMRDIDFLSDFCH